MSGLSSTKRPAEPLGRGDCRPEALKSRQPQVRKILENKIWAPLQFRDPTFLAKKESPVGSPWPAIPAASYPVPGNVLFSASRADGNSVDVVKIGFQLCLEPVGFLADAAQLGLLAQTGVDLVKGDDREDFLHIGPWVLG